MIVTVDAGRRRLVGGAIATGCAIGRAGACAAADKSEGDGRTPLGEWPIRGVLLRPDRTLAIPRALSWRWLRRDDGWSDDPGDPAYNRPVRHPHRFSAERLWREDALYDAIILLGHNDAPPAPGMGSAIFLHVMAGATTEGCVAVPCDAMIALLDVLTPGSVLRITE